MVGKSEELPDKAKKLKKLIREVYAIVLSLRKHTETYRERLLGHRIDLAELENQLRELWEEEENPHRKKTPPKIRDDDKTPTEPLLARKASETFRAVTDSLKKSEDENR